MKRLQENLEQYVRDFQEKISYLQGLKLIKSKFFESREVWDDPKGTLMPGKIPGYRILKSKRIR